MEREEFAERLAAVERAVTGGETDCRGLEDHAALRERVAEVESELDRRGDRVDDLEGAVQALRGYAGGIDAVNRDVERRANAALAAVDRLADDRDGAGTADRDGGIPDGDANAAPAASDRSGATRSDAERRGGGEGHDTLGADGRVEGAPHGVAPGETGRRAPGERDKTDGSAVGGHRHASAHGDADLACGPDGSDWTGRHDGTPENEDGLLGRLRDVL